MPFSALRRRGVAALILAAAVLYALLSWSADYDPDIRSPGVGLGESMLHGLACDGISYAMPLSSVAEAVHRNHMPPSLRRAFTLAVMAAALLLVFGLGRLLHSDACGALAAAVAAWSGLISFVDGVEHVLFLLLILLTANLLAWRARSPDLWRGVWVGLGIGLSLLTRSTLALLPLILTAYELARREEPLATRIKRLLPVWGVPLLLLLPWLYMNGSVHGRLIPFEDGRAGHNLAAGALGFVTSVEVAGTDLLELAGVREGESVARWAAAEILAHPLRYAAGFAGRVWYAVSLHPVICILALLSLWVFRKREDHRQVALLAATFIGAHCLMGVETRYFEHIWPVVTVLAAGAVADRLQPLERPAPLASLAMAGACLLPLCAFSLFVSGLVSAYPHRADAGASLEAVERALKGHPDDPWLRSERGRWNMRAGEFEAAARDFALALSADPGEDRRIDFSWALLSAGHAARNPVPETGRNSDSRDARRGHVLRALGALMRGAEREAALFWAAAEEVDRDCAARGLPSRRERALVEKMCASSDMLERIAIEFVELWPPQRRLKALEGIRALSGGRAVIDVRLAREYADLGQGERAARLVSSLLGRRAEEPSLRLWLDAAAAAAGEPGLAGRCLRRAEDLKPGPRQLRRMAGLYAELKDARRVSTIYRALLELSPDDAGLLIERAAHLGKAGAREQAEASLKRAIELSPGPEQLRRIALVYQEWGLFDRAIGILDPLTSVDPVAPLAFMDKGVCEYLGGSPDKAVESLEAAIRLDPGLLPAYLTLGTVHTSQGRRKEAVEVYDRALAGPPRSGDRADRRLILESRAGLTRR